MKHRLLIFISSLSCGGAERVTANLANHWACQGWQVTVVTLSDRADDFYELSPCVQRSELGMLKESANPLLGVYNNLRRVLALRRTLRKIQPDIALAMMDTANVLLALAAWGMPNVVALGAERIHPPQLPLTRQWQFLRRHCYAFLEAVVALTDESRTWLLQNTKATRVVVIPNAVPWPLPTQAPIVWPETIIPTGRKMLLAVGRLVDQKGFDLLIDAYAAIAEQYADWHLAIVGEGPLRTRLLTQIKQTGLEGRITLVGHVGNMGDWYRAAQLYVMSSRFEGFPNTLVEALSYGVPAVSFDCDTGPRDIIRHEIDGLLVPPGDVAALSAALARLMGDGALRRQYGARAIEARERFSIERIIGMWEQLFLRLRNERGHVGCCNQNARSFQTKHQVTQEITRSSQYKCNTPSDFGPI